MGIKKRLLISFLNILPSLLYKPANKLLPPRKSVDMLILIGSWQNMKKYRSLSLYLRMIY